MSLEGIVNTLNDNTHTIVNAIEANTTSLVESNATSAASVVGAIATLGLDLDIALTLLGGSITTDIAALGVTLVSSNLLTQGLLTTINNSILALSPTTSNIIYTEKQYNWASMSYLSPGQRAGTITFHSAPETLVVSSATHITATLNGTWSMDISIFLSTPVLFQQIVFKQVGNDTQYRIIITP